MHYIFYQVRDNNGVVLTEFDNDEYDKAMAYIENYELSEGESIKVYLIEEREVAKRRRI
jgi:hypothetical protein